MAADEQYAQPSRNPANDDSLVGVLRQVLDKFLLGVDDMLPAQVIAFDRNSNRAQVKPLIKLLTTEGQEVERPQIASVPVFQIGGGGMVLNFNLKPGDLGWIKANDRDISLSMQSGGEAKPNSFRKHSFEDGVFFPDAMRNFVIQGEDAENAVLQTMDGNVRVAIWPEFVKVTAPKGLLIANAEASQRDAFMLDISSHGKAARPWPQMTLGERDSIPVTSDDEGAAVWLTDHHRLSTYNGMAWS